MSPAAGHNKKKTQLNKKTSWNVVGLKNRNPYLDVLLESAGTAVAAGLFLSSSLSLSLSLSVSLLGFLVPQCDSRYRSIDVYIGPRPLKCRRPRAFLFFWFSVAVAVVWWHFSFLFRHQTHPPPPTPTRHPRPMRGRYANESLADWILHVFCLFFFSCNGVAGGNFGFAAPRRY